MFVLASRLKLLFEVVVLGASLTRSLGGQSERLSLDDSSPKPLLTEILAGFLALLMEDPSNFELISYSRCSALIARVFMRGPLTRNNFIRPLI